MANPLLQAGYRELSYEDESGRWFSVLLPPGVPDSDARRGMLLGPQVDLSSLGLPFEIEVKLHNALHSRRIFTYADARRTPANVQGALMAAFKLDAGRIIESYGAAGVD